MAGQWAYEGDAAVQKTQQHDATMALQLELRKMQLKEFYLKAGESTQLLFLDDFKFFYYRHLIPNGRGGFDPVTCLSELGDCPLCKAGKAKQWVGCATVIDLRRSFESTKNPGKVYKFQKYILAAGQEGRNRLLHLG